MKVAKRNLRALADAKRTNRKRELIEIVKRSSLECGKALMELRDDEHWKETHLSFKEFCEHNFSISGSYLYELIQAVKVKDSLPESLRKNITNSKEAILLGKVPEPDRAKAVERYAKLGGNSTPLLREITQNYIPVNGCEKSAQADSSVSVKSGSATVSKSVSNKPDPNRDEAQNAITPEALPYWKRKPEVEKYLDKLKDVMDLVNRAKDTTDPMYARMPKSLPERITQAYLDLLVVVPHSICPKCHGEPSLKPNGCDDCGNTGMISKADYEKINPPKPTV